MRDHRTTGEIDIASYYEQYGPMVLRRCRFLLKDEDRALDATQEVFVKLIENQHRLEGTYPSSLLYRIATNVSLNMIRSESRRRTDGNPDLIETIASEEDIEEHTAVRDLLHRLFHTEKPSTREIAVMYYVDSMTYEEVARETGLSVSGVRKRLRTLRSKARKMEVADHARNP